MQRARTDRGFTLVEVMLALAILFGGLVVLIQSTAGNIYTAERSYMLGVATDLARGKMYDLEEELRREGFQELDQELEGDFDDEGWPSIEWKAVIIKPEIPDLATIQAAQGQDGEGGEDGESSGSSSIGPGGGGGGLFGGMMGGGAGGRSGESSGGGSFIPPQMFTMVQDVLKESVRKVELTVTWETAGGEDSMEVECYFTEPKAMGQVIPGAGSAGGGGRGGLGGQGGDKNGEADDDDDGGGRSGGGRGGGRRR